MIDAKELERDLAAFSDPATPFSFESKNDRSVTRLVRYGKEREYFIDLQTGSISGRHNKRQHLSLKALLASDEFADLRGFAATQRRVLASKKLDELIAPAGVIDPDASRTSLTLTIGRQLVRPVDSIDAASILLIDGPAGVGKTSFIERMVFERSADATLPPILHITSKGRRLSNLADAIGKTASDLQADFRADQVPTLARLNALQVAIDGFDELVQPDGFGHAWAALEDFIRSMGRGGPLILAGRDTFFDQQDVRKRLDRFGTKVNLTMVRLHEVTEKTARTWLEKRGWNAQELTSQGLKQFFQRSYTRRPFFLSQIARYKSFTDLPLERGSPQAILIEELIDREVKLIGIGISTASLASIKDALILLFEGMATDMAEREADTIPREFLEFYCDVSFEGLVSAEELSAIRHKIGSAAFIETNETRGDLCFPHSEIQNHFHARAIFRALVRQKPYSALRSAVFGTDLVEAFADINRTAPLDESKKAVAELLRLLAQESFAIRFVSNLTALIVASLVRGEIADKPLMLKGVATNEARVFDELSAAHFIDVSIGRLDARGADLSNIIFENCQIGALIVDDTTRFGDFVPTIGTLQIDQSLSLLSEHSQDGIEAWLKTHSSAFGIVDESDWRRGRDLPLVKFFDRVCRRFIRQHYIRDNETDEGSALLHDRKWAEIVQILSKEKRIEIATRSAAPTSHRGGKFYHVIAPEKLLVPDSGTGDKVAQRIRLAVIKRAEELGGA